MKKVLFVMTAIIGFVVISCTATKQATTASQYKNLKVLPQNINRVQMDSVMHHFTGSLNVKCNFCHVRTADNKEWNFAADDNKHKLVARQMMTMTQKINDQYFKVADTKTLDTKLMVTCYTCHHGANDPATKVPVQARP